MLEELRYNEQYFFTKNTSRELLNLVPKGQNACFLCCPMVALEANITGVDGILLDFDTRFANLPSFRFYDLNKPYDPEDLLGQQDILFFDPPFFNVSLLNLTCAVSALLSKKGTAYIAYLKRNEKKLRGAMKRFGLEIKRTTFELDYETVTNEDGRISLYQVKFAGEVI